MNRRSARRGAVTLIVLALTALSLFWGGTASAYPWMIRHPYSGCVPCHADPTGSGLLTPYGRALSEQVLRTRYGKVSPEDQGELGQFMWNAVTLPDWLLMGASFRNTSQILELAGCDLLTIGTGLLEELQKAESPVVRKLGPDLAGNVEIKKLDLDDKTFRFLLNEDAMATEKTAEGIRAFSADIVKMEALITSKLQ